MSGNKNYFRHSCNAGVNPKIEALIAAKGKEAYFHYFQIIELCASVSEQGQTEFSFHPRTICNRLKITRRRLSAHLVAMQSAHLLDVVVSESQVELTVSNLPEYFGTYSLKKERKERKKEKEPKTLVSQGDVKKKVNVKPKTKLKTNQVEIEEIINHLNSLTGKSFSPKTKETIRLLGARLKTHNADLIKCVISNKVPKWVSDSKTKEWLRPKTLFAESNFENYLNDMKATEVVENCPFGNFIDGLNSKSGVAVG